MENNKIFINRQMNNNPFYMAPVEIIIPFHGEQSKVTRLMESIFKTVHTNRYLITLVDDGSKNKNFIKQVDKGKVKGVRCFQQETQKGFGAAVNIALNKPWNKKIIWVAIIQSDVLVSDNNWLSNIGETLNKLKGDNVKMISPLTDNPMSDLPELCGEKAPLTRDVVLRDGFLPMYCVLAHRELFERVGPLKECPYAGTEAEEYALRMNAMGYKQGVCGSSWVHHDGGATLSHFAKNEKVQEILRKVRQDFLAEHKKEAPAG